MPTKTEKVNIRIDGIIERIRGTCPEQIWLAKEYSKAHLIKELEEIQKTLKVKKRKPKIKLQSRITCPECGTFKTETMSTVACHWFYDCTGCGSVLKPKKGDCCVFCSYGTEPCPSIQEERNNYYDV